MCLEIEAKVRVQDFSGVAGRLAAVGAEHYDDVTHLDTFYSDASGTMLKAGSALRLRRQTGRLAEKAILTYKGPKQKRRFKTRKEIEVEVLDAAAMAELLVAAGFRVELVLEKRRSLWRHKGCQVCLDELPILGRFVEGEGPSEDVIEAVLKDLHLDALPHIGEGYASLIRRRLAETGSTGREVLFER